MSPHNLAASPVRFVDNHRIVEIDTKKARYMGIPWRDLGDFGKRKFENLVVLRDTSELVTVTYA